ncbi:glucosamine-6-phosphate isomerase, partial [human gut metagenome]
TESTIQANARLFDDVSDVPTQALTMGIKTIMEAKKVLMLISGKDKSGYCQRSFHG